MQRDLFLALLSMDAYNRGLPESRPGTLIPNYETSDLGFASFIRDSPEPLNAIGFFAVAYTLSSGEKFISYRGTDQPTAGNGLGGDIWNGYGLATGSPHSAQTAAAIRFYQSVIGVGTNPQTANVTLTGHSLGGGLAGIVGALYGRNGVLFDNMMFENGANAANSQASTVTFTDEFGNEHTIPGSQALKDLIYGGGEPWPIDRNALRTIYLEGEFLAAGRISQSTPKKMLDLGPGVDLPGIDSFSTSSRHSMSLLVIRQFADEPEIGSTSKWRDAAKYFMPELFSDSIAQAVGALPFKGTNTLSGVLRDAIAYSAIDGGAMPFGNDGIRALFDDANDLGKAFKVSTPNTLLAHDDVKKALAQIAVQFAGDLALAKSMDTAARAGTFSLLDGDARLKADLDPAKWVSTFNIGTSAPNVPRTGGLEKIIGVEALADALIFSVLKEDPGSTAKEIQLATVFGTWKPNTKDVTRLELATGATAVTLDATDAPKTKAQADGGAILVGGGGNDTITGGKGHDLLVGGAGNDNAPADGAVAA